MLNIISGTIKIIDDNGNVQEVHISTLDIVDTLDHMLLEMKKMNMHLSKITEEHISSSDVDNLDD